MTFRQKLSTPAAEAAAGALVGAALARLGAGYAVSRYGDPSLALDPSYMRNAKRVSMLIGALAGAANPLLRDADIGSWREFAASMTKPHADAVPRAASSEFDPAPFLGTVDKRVAEDVLRSDLFLKPFERQGVLGVLGRAPESPQGRTSQFGLTQAALRAGIAFVPAYTFGELAGKALGADPSTVRRLSRMGALAYALRSSGITEYLK